MAGTLKSSFANRHPALTESRLEELLKFVETETAYLGVTPEFVEYSDVGGDADTMLQDGNVAEEMHKIKGWLKYFSVSERKKRRRRRPTKVSRTWAQSVPTAEESICGCIVF